MEKIRVNNFARFFHAECLEEQYSSERVPNFYQSQNFELIWIKKGKGIFTIDFDKREIIDNSLYCIFPGQIHRIVSEQAIEGYRISFSADFLCSGNTITWLPIATEYPSRGEQSWIVMLNHEAEREIEDITQTIFWECRHKPLLSTEMLEGLIKLIFAYVSRMFNVKDFRRVSDNDQLVFVKFMNHLDQKFRMQKQVSIYAENLAISSNYLSEVVKRVSGYSASFHVHQRVVLEAKRMAISTSAPMKQIAWSLGFEDPSTFSKFFKIQTGINFSDFRNGWSSSHPIVVQKDPDA